MRYIIVLSSRHYYKKVLYILDMFLFVNEREFSNFGSLYQILGYIDDFFKIQNWT
jgi:hypothetical protein